MVGESFFRIFSLGLLSLIFIAAFASTDKEPQLQQSKDQETIFSHIHLAAQANAFNNNLKKFPPEMDTEAEQPEKALPKARP